MSNLTIKQRLTDAPDNALRGRLSIAYAKIFDYERWRSIERQWSLTPRETQVCIMMVKGMLMSEMCRQLNLKQPSIETYCRHARIKLRVANRHELATKLATLLLMD